MKYISTRGQAPELAFDDVLLTGLARDGGLYVPHTWPRFEAAEIKAMAGLSYTDCAFRVISPFIAGTIADDDLAAIIAATYSNFDHDQIAPLKSLGSDDWLMELFHGPTLAFKDYAMQFLGRVFDHVLNQRNKRVTIVGATSGDTGSAAIEAFRGSRAVDIYILHPEGRVSEVQRRQMTTVIEPNVFNIAIKGTFDDCQALVKALFNDQAFRDEINLSAVNSINWARVMAQIVYYFYGAVALGAPERPVSFAVPTGNFGNVFAGYTARQMGLNIEQLIIGSNSNDILTRFFKTGRMQTGDVSTTLSPSMDIQISSNFERLLFDLCDRDGAAVRSVMGTFAATGAFDLTAGQLQKARQSFQAARFDDKQTKGVIGDVYRQTGELLDPHTAVGLAAGRAMRANAGTPLVTLATAHPAKFPDAVESATWVRPKLPGPLADLFERQESFSVLDNDLAQVQAFVRDHRTDKAA